MSIVLELNCQRVAPKLTSFSDVLRLSNHVTWARKDDENKKLIKCLEPLLALRQPKIYLVWQTQILQMICIRAR